MEYGLLQTTLGRVTPILCVKRVRAVPVNARYRSPYMSMHASSNIQTEQHATHL